MLLFPWQKDKKGLQDQYVRKIILYSTIVIFVIPLVIGSLQAFHDNALEGSPEGFAKAYQTLITSSMPIRNLMQLVMQESLSIANNGTLIDLGDYNYLENSPGFMIKDYLEGDLDLEDFAKKNHQVIRTIEFFDEQIKIPSKRNFLN
ncbi:1729_t:CDS:2 [Funneliformis geosporum]|uniref:1729_t:CDS:1 n=1 Tax=Funneliformis geosporum TaxID=1117311 RepID=A0A9W4SN60_9GLOM|nr:1729_t:CDS:2 [Funneliformis geosporum]